MATEANIQIENLESPQNGITFKIIHISGQLDESNVDEKIQEVYKVVEASPKGLFLIFDLDALQYMNSKSIGYLTDLYGKITEGGGKIAIANAKANIVDILQVVGLTQLIDTYDSIETAKSNLFNVQTAQPVQIQPQSTPVQPQPVQAQPVTPPAAPSVQAQPQPADVTLTPASPAETSEQNGETYKFDK